MFTAAEKRLLALLTGVQFVLILDYMMLMPLAPQLMREAGLDPSSFSRLVSAHTLCAALAGFAAAFALDRFERKRALVFALVGFTAGGILCCLAEGFSSLLTGRAVCGVFMGLAGAALFAILSDAIPLARRGTALGIVMSAFALAAVIGVPAGLVVGQRFGWALSFLPQTVIGALLIAFASRMPEMRGHLAHGKPSWPASAKKVGDLLFTRGRFPAFLFVFCLILGHFSVNPFLFPSFVSNAGLPESWLPLTYLVAGLVSIVASLVSGRLADRFGIRKTFAVFLVISLAALVNVTSLGSSSLPFILGTTAFFFFFLTARMTPAVALVTSTAPAERRGALMGLTGAFQSLAIAAGSAVAGATVERSADGGLLHYDRVGWFAVVFSLIAFVVSFAVKPAEGPA